MGDLFLVILATVVVVMAILAMLITLNFLSEYKKLRAGGCPRPGFIVRRRYLRFLPSFGPRDLQVLAGSRAWVSWDLRWLTSGETLARVTRVDPQTGVLGLELASAIILGADEKSSAVEASSVEFVPHGAGRTAYGRKVIRGTLRPEFPGGITATAELVLYPEHRSRA